MQKSMTAWKNCPNRYDINLVKAYDINSVRNNQVRVVDTKQINAVLMQPHWRHHRENEKHESVSFSKEKPDYGPGGF
jgi:hypothetical protein